MGNHFTCCRQRWFQLGTDNLSDDVAIDNEINSMKRFCYFNSTLSANEQTICHPVSTPSSLELLNSFGGGSVPSSNTRWSTQHISEREPEDWEFDPSLNASHHALFLADVSGKTTRPYSAPFGSGLSHTVRLRRWSSCYTVFVGDGWIVCPHKSSVLRSVSIAIKLLLGSSLNQTVCCTAFDRSNPTFDIYNLFDERKFPLVFQSSFKPGSIPPLRFGESPSEHDIHTFIRTLFRSRFLGPQTAIVALIFLERLLNAAELGLTNWSWRRQFLACVLLASKVLDDQAVWNTDYRGVLKDVPVEDLNALERHTLSLLQFNINVPLPVYTRYYFDLQSVGETRDVVKQPLKRQLLTPRLAKQLQIFSDEDDIRCNREESCLRSILGINNQESSSRHDMENGKHNQSRSKGKSTAFDREKARSSSCHTDLPTLNEPDAMILVCSPSKKEDPLILDDETEYVNTLTLPDMGSLSAVPNCNSTSPAPEMTENRIRPPPTLPVWSPLKKFRSKLPTSGYVRLDNSPTDTAGPCKNDTNTLNFMRSVMGGDVAYTLLSENGIY